jgi:uncharacterized membrane protein
VRREITRIVHRNVQTLLEVERQADLNKSWQEHVADSVTAFAGSMTFVLVHLFLFGGWIIWNITPLPRFDSYPFVGLAMFASVEAIFLSTFILISQNRMNALAEQRSDLDLQVSLLAEHELTQLIRLVDVMAKKMGLTPSEITNVEDMKKDVPPEVVLDTIEKEKQEAKNDDVREP